jgi:hypothetical protein
MRHTMLGKQSEHVIPVEWLTGNEEVECLEIDRRRVEDRIHRLDRTAEQFTKELNANSRLRRTNGGDQREHAR